MEIELAEAENIDLVMDFHSAILDAIGKGAQLSSEDLQIYEINFVLNEVNSGDSFEQYFRWADVGQIRRVVEHLREAGFTAASEITEKAITVAFPNGIPLTEEEKDDLTDWTDEQEMRLSELAHQFQDSNGTITNSLAHMIRRNGPETQYLNDSIG